MSDVVSTVDRALETMSALASLHAAVETVALAGRLAERSARTVGDVAPEVRAFHQSLIAAVEAAERAVVVLDETLSLAVKAMKP